MFKIIHLSDTHIGEPGCLSHFLKIVKYLKHQCQPATDYIVMITGDLSAGPAKDPRYKQTKFAIFALKALGFSVLVCPGNHDYDVKDKTQATLFKSTFYGDSNVTYPKVDIFRDREQSDYLIAVGLDSMPEELDWTDTLSNNGEIGAAQIARLNHLFESEIFNNSTYRVLYLHHHPFGKQGDYTLIDADQLLSVIESSKSTINLMLFGHKHEGKAFNNMHKVPWIFDAGTSTCKGNGPGVLRIIDLKKGEIERSVDLRQLFAQSDLGC